MKVYEMALSEYSFHVLTPIFGIHWGLQLKQQRRLPAWRKRQMEANRQLFDGTIHQELKVKYSNATILNNNNNNNNIKTSAMQQQQQQHHSSSALGSAVRWRGIKSVVNG